MKDMEKIRVELGERSYDIIIGNHYPRRLGDNLKALRSEPDGRHRK